jgi:hypothetical protein
VSECAVDHDHDDDDDDDEHDDMTATRVVVLGDYDGCDLNNGTI